MQRVEPNWQEWIASNLSAGCDPADMQGRMVAAGEWRDYAIAAMRDLAVFAVFRRTAETPLYRIEKRPRLRAAQGEYAVIGMDGRILKRGHDLPAVLRVLEKKLIRPID